MTLVRNRPQLALYAAGLLMVAMAFAGPIMQPAGYHDFADQRAMFGIPNFLDVMSNLGFLLVGVWGLLRMAWNGRRDAAHAIFFAAIVLTAVGSSWYHLAPSDLRLVWDRLPIALACAAILAASIRDVYPRAMAVAPLMVFGVGSVYWWTLTGDLRPYLLLQLAPLVLIPLLQWQGRAPMEKRIAFGVAIGLYVLAKLFELGDGATFECLGVVSGHTIKHGLATLAAVAVGVATVSKPATVGMRRPV